MPLANTGVFLVRDAPTDAVSYTIPKLEIRIKTDLYVVVNQEGDIQGEAVKRIELELCSKGI
jgi:hypothetical protein